MADLRHTEDFRKILVVRLSSLGDIVHTLPAVHLLKERFPHAEIHWAVKEGYRDLLLESSVVDSVVPVNIDQWKASPFSPGTFAQVRGLARRLRDEGYDLVVDFQSSLKSGFIAFLSRSPLRLGFSPSHCREPLNAVFTNKWVTLDREKVHKVEMYASLLRAVGIETSGLPRVCLSPSPEGEGVEGFLEREVGGEGPRVAINPGARWETKRWPPGHWARLADALQKEGAKVIVLWGPGEREVASQVGDSMGFFPMIPPMTNLKQLLFLLSEMDLVISGDTGPLHLAAALGVPVIGLYGPTDPVLNGPYGQLGRVVETPLSCRGCWKRTCPGGTCMSSIPSEKVYSLALRLLGR